MVHIYHVVGHLGINFVDITSTFLDLGQKTLGYIQNGFTCFNGVIAKIFGAFAPEGRDRAPSAIW